MSNSKDSDLQPEIILTEKYKNLCEHLLSMVEDEKIREKMKRNII